MPWKATARGQGISGIPLAPGEADWIDMIAAAPPMRIAIIGGSGRLGSWLTTILSETGHRVRVLDTRVPVPQRGVEFAPVSLTTRADMTAKLNGVDCAVHLAAVHGAHLAEGRPRRDFWQVNVSGTHQVFAECARAGVKKVVVASSTSVYGSGTQIGRARVLDEDSPLAPEDVYDYTKIATERLLEDLRRRTSIQATALRLGRFFYPSEHDYQLRKLSTGLDIFDACQAVIRVLLAGKLPRSAYCAASDLPLSCEQRERLGIDLPSVLEEALPGILDRCRERGLVLPTRVGKSVDTSALAQDADFRPCRTLAWSLELEHIDQARLVERVAN